MTRKTQRDSSEVASPNRAQTLARAVRLLEEGSDCDVCAKSDDGCFYGDWCWSSAWEEAVGGLVTDVAYLLEEGLVEEANAAIDKFEERGAYPDVRRHTHLPDGSPIKP